MSLPVSTERQLTSPLPLLHNDRHKAVGILYYLIFIADVSTTKQCRLDLDKADKTLIYFLIFYAWNIKK